MSAASMRAAVLRGNNHIEVADVERPGIGDDEVLVRVGANTLCGTDVRIVRGEKTKGIRPGAILGHEFSGHVARAGRATSGYDVGTPVGMAPLVACGHCAYCRRDSENLCPRQRMMGYEYAGGLSEYVRIPAAAVRAGNLVAAAQGRPAEQLALAEPLACCLNGQERSAVGLDDVVLIMGAGPIGLFHVQLALLRGARTVVVSEPSAPRRELAARFGAHATVDPGDDLATAVDDATGGHGADVTMICIGVPPLVDDALRVTRPGGRVNVFAGMPKQSTSTVEANLVHYKELRVTGTSACRRVHYETAFRLIETGRVEVGPMITHRFPLTEVDKALAVSAGGEGLKVAVLPATAEQGG